MGGGTSKSSKAESNYVLSVSSTDEFDDIPSAGKAKYKGKLVERKSSPDCSPGPSPKPSPQQTTRKSIDRGTNPVMLGSIGRQNSRGGSNGSISALSRQGSTVGKGGSILGVTSERIPWLLKGGNFTNMTISALDQGRVIGTGLMGTVRIVTISGRKQYFALKSVRKDYISRHNDERHLRNERILMNMLNNPFCVKLFCTMQDSVHVYFAMELAVGGELFRRLSKKSYFPAQVAKFYVCEIFSALEHVQGLGYVYRDLKPENVMLDEDGHCKLVDFGFSTVPDANGVVKTLCGTPQYLSPEQLDGKFTHGYHKIVDWWSLGILIYELMTGKTPFCNSNSETSYEIYLRILKNNISFPRGFDNPSKDLVKRLCHADVSKRLASAESISSHEYFTIPWPAVHARKLIPPYIPRISDDSDRDHYFNKYGEMPKVAETADSCSLYLEGF